MSRRQAVGGKLRIGDHWSAISIIALSQDNPLKAVAEFAENSIDAGAKNVQIVRGRQRNEPFLRVIDDGEGVRCDDAGVPDFPLRRDTHLRLDQETAEEGGGGLLRPPIARWSVTRYSPCWLGRSDQHGHTGWREDERLA